jgi:hypothetical protein
MQYFETHVRPILVQKCYACHSAKTPKPQGGLLLDTRDGLLQGGPSGPSVVPGDPEKSPLIKAIRFQSGIQMPPAGKLPEREIAALVEWVRMGAPDPREGVPGLVKARKTVPVAEGLQRWAFQKPGPVKPPAVKNTAWVRNPIDRFILARLEAKGLRPNPPAPAGVLLRRASFDLIGLPPTPAELEAFLQAGGPSPAATNGRMGEREKPKGATPTHAAPTPPLPHSPTPKGGPAVAPTTYRSVVDRLLQSPHYGERWGRHWLDLARYAESHGFEHDYDRPNAYHYRDFVIRALNAGMPYNQFVKWQIAGDEFAPEDPLALAATGFLAAGTHSTQITKNLVEKERYDELDDMTATIGTSMLGLTLGCARCHDHKFDPIPQKDYYRLVATFTKTVRSDFDVDVDPEGYRLAKAAWDKEHAPLIAARDGFERDRLATRFDAWLTSTRSTTPASERSAQQEPGVWRVLDNLEVRSKEGATFTDLGDGSHLAGGKNADYDTYTLIAHTRLDRITAIRLEALAHPSMVKGGPGRAANGNFALSDVRVTVNPLGVNDPGRLAPAPLARAAATFEQSGLPVAATIDADAKSSWAVDPQFGKDHAAVFELAEPAGFGSGSVVTVTLKFAGNTGHNIGRVRLAVTGAALPVKPDAPASLEGVQSLLDQAAAGQPLTPAERGVLLKWYRARDKEWQALDGKVQAHLAAMPKPRLQKMLISSEGVPAVRLHTQGGDFLEATHLLRRGDPNQKAEVVRPGFLQVLTRTAEADQRWKEQPPAGWRTPYQRRALANWITDPEQGAGFLLARVIVNRVWQHHFGRGIVATPSDFGAQGEPATHPELLDWLAQELIRGGWKLKPIHQLIMTSAAYQQSSAVDPVQAKADPTNRLFGRQNRRRLEAEVIRDSLLAVSGELDRTPFGPGTLDEAHKRRSIYFTVKRSKLIPSLSIFDAPDALQGLGVRPTTTVAPQALHLLNNPQVRAWAAAFARKVAPTEQTPFTQAVTAAYLSAVGRQPSPAELQDAIAFLNQQSAAYAASAPTSSRALALADFCQVLFGLNEFIYVD